MKNLLKIAFLGFVFAFNFSTLKASHMMGGDISYRCIGDKKYEFIITIYRDCRGIPFNSPYIKMFDANLMDTVVLSYTRTSIDEITFFCNDTMRNCFPANTTAGNGIERHIFKSYVDFNVAPFNQFVKANHCEIFVSAEQQSRNGAITNIIPGNFYIETFLNVCNSNYKNSSPEFVLPGSFMSSCNVEFSSNFGGTDYIEGDSVSYELGSPMSGHNTFAGYYGQFTPQTPMTPYCPPNPGKLNCKPIPTARPPRGFYFNTQTGEIVFTPTKCDEVGVVNLKMHEYRKVNGQWLHLGYVMRDIQITIIKQGNNLSPRVTTSSNSYNFKLREETCFEIVTSDIYNIGNTADSTSIRLINPPSGMTITYLDSNAKNKIGRVCWTPPDSLLIQTKNLSKQLLLIAEINDNNCPSPFIIRKSINLTILPPDSFGYLDVQTYHDSNGNKKFDLGELSLPSRLYIQHDSTVFGVSTNSEGEYKTILPIGNYKIGTQLHPYYISNQVDTTITILDSFLHYVEFPRTLKKGIHGRVYYDANGNCQFDNGESVAAGIRVYTDTGKIMAITDNNGFYYLPVTDNKTYQIEAEILDFKYKVMCPSNNIHTVIYTSNTAVEGINFGIDNNPDYFNIKVSHNLRLLRRANSTPLTLYADNVGNKTAYNLKLYFAVPIGINIKDGSNIISTGGDTLVFEIDSLVSKANFTKKLNINANPNIYSNNELVCFKTWTDSNTLTLDSVKHNNHYQSCIRVTGPYDPNEKTTALEHVTPMDDYIDYVVHFQNTGNDTAFRVLVIDTIHSPYLDIEGLQLNWSDAPCATYVSGNVLYFEFNDIRLPHLSSAGDKSIAGFGFRLRLKNHRNKTDVIKNKVGIYFDFEDEIITKECLTPIKSPVEITNQLQGSLCYGQKQIIEFESNVELNKGDIYLLEISDINGSFDNPILLRSKPALNSIDSFHFSMNGQNFNNRMIRININRANGFGIPDDGLKTFTVDSFPVYQMQSNLVNNEICNNETLNLNFNSFRCEYKTVINNDYSQAYSNSNNLQIKIKEGNEYKVLVKKGNSECVDTIAFDFTIKPQPDIMLQFKDNLYGYCPGDSIRMITGGAKTYSYYSNNQIIGSNISSSYYSFLADQQNDVYVIGTADNGCSNSSDTLDIVLYPLPVKSPITANKNTLNINYYPKIEWYRNNNLLSDTGTTLLDAPTGTYKAKLYNEHSCSVFSDDYMHQYVGIHSSVYDAQFVIYPNPSSGIFTFQHEMKGDVQIFIYNAEGKQILKSTLTAASTEINLSEYDNGVYCVLILAENGKSISKTIELLK